MVCPGGVSFVGFSSAGVGDGGSSVCVGIEVAVGAVLVWVGASVCVGIIEVAEGTVLVGAS